VSSELLAKKAKKNVARNHRFLVTMSDSESTLHLSVGERFLLFLPPQGEPPALRWTISMMAGSDPNALLRSTDDLPIPRGQGFFQAAHSGQVFMHLDASPVCPPAPRWVCEQSGANFGMLDLRVIVE
jgi:hypothetical protein